MKIREFSVAMALFLAGHLAHAQAQDPLPRATPESQGMSSKRLQRLGAAIQADVDAGRMAGAVVAVARNGKLVYHEAIGWQDKRSEQRMAKDSIFAIASMTKPIVAVGTLLMQEENLLQLNHPVTRYLPVLETQGVIDGKVEDAKAPFKTVPLKRPVTLLDLMRHTAGMPFGNRGNSDLHKAWPSSGITTAEAMNGEEFLTRIAALPLHAQPGTKWDYSLGFDVLGLAMESAAKKPLEEILTPRLFAPLGMRDTSFVLPAEKFPRLARPLVDPKTGRLPATYDAAKGTKFQCGGGCLVSTAGDYLRFYQMMLDKGHWDGNQLVSRKSIEYMTSNHLSPGVDRSALDAYPNIEGYGFGLGVAVRQVSGIAGVMGSVGDFHWHGATGSLGWVDPQERLVVVFMAQTSGPIRFENRLRVSALVYQALH